MSLAKARQLLRLAEMAASRHRGVTLSDIVAEFEADHRTAQRLVRALEEIFEGVEITVDEQRRRHWRLRDTRLLRLQGLRDSELAALELSIRRAEREGATTEARALSALRDRLLAEMPRPHARRAEADAEAVLEASGYASRPGPRIPVAPLVLETVTEALKGPFRLQIAYQGPRDPEPRLRAVEPYGLLLGVRRYLVAAEPGSEPALRHFRLDRIRQAALLPETFVRPAGFSLADHAARAFGSFHSDAEYGEVVWRFVPEAAPVARDFVFHPTQELTTEPDGALTVRFRACGWLEMAWHLYQWGDKVEVLAPPELRAMVAGHRRADFSALP